MPLLELTISLVKDDTGKLVGDDYVNAIAAALKRYSKHRPHLDAADIEGDGGHDYALPEGWQPGLSAVQSVEFPVGLVPEVMLDPRDYRLYQHPEGTKLRLLYLTPEAGEMVRLTYNALHTEETVPEADLSAVADLAASICCSQLAAAYGQTSDPTIQADTVNYRSKTDEFRRLADFLAARYKEHLGIKENDPTPSAFAVAESGETTRTRLTHSRRRRP